VGTTAKPSVSEEDVDGMRRRRRWSAQEKLQIVFETLDGSASVPVIARRHNLNANQLFSWRGQYRRGELTAQAENPDTVKLLPVHIEPSVPIEPGMSQRREDPSPPGGCLEIQLCGTRHVKIWGAMDARVLRVMIRELLRTC
jgi:transposase